MWSVSGVVGFLVLMFIIGTIAGPPKKGDSKPIAKAAASAAESSSSAAPSSGRPSAPTATTLSPKPEPATTAPTTNPPTTASPTEKTCGPERDVVVWMKVPDLPDSAQVLGNYNLATCEPTFQWLQETSPTDAGYCTEAAWASDNPGYSADAEPAKRPQGVQVTIGPAC